MIFSEWAQAFLSFFPWLGTDSTIALHLLADTTFDPMLAKAIL